MDRPGRPSVSRPYPLAGLPPDCYYAEPQTPESVGASSLMIVEESDPFDLYTYRLTHILHAGRTRFQNAVIGETLNYGRALFLDGAVQSAADDEALYHELLVQPAMLCHPEPRDVLILGGGEGATLREVLIHRSVHSATMVDLDEELVELCRAHLPQWHRGAFADKRARLVFADGRAFVAGDDGLYDVIVVDLVDMIEDGPAAALYTRQFYEMLRRRLRPGGVVAVQGLEFSFLDYKPHAAMLRTLQTIFAEVHSYRADIPSFLSGWGFIIASDWLRPEAWSAAEIDRTIAARLGTWPDHLDGAFLRSCFALCKETRLALAQSGPILEDGVAFVAPPDIEDVDPAAPLFPLPLD